MGYTNYWLRKNDLDEESGTYIDDWIVRGEPSMQSIQNGITRRIKKENLVLPKGIYQIEIMTDKSKVALINDAYSFCIGWLKVKIANGKVKLIENHTDIEINKAKGGKKKCQSKN